MTVMDSATQTSKEALPVAFYGKMLTFSRVKLSTNDLAVIEEKLASTLGNKSSNIPVILETDIEQDLPALVDLLWSYGLQPIGVVAGVLETQAREQRLAIFPADGKRIERILPSKKPATLTSQTMPVSNVESAETGATNQTPKPSLADETPEMLLSVEHITSMIYDQMLRSGQSLNHVGGDLILTNSINSGAEAITDNSLHVYGRAQGRLVAGATGDKEARIFCQIFNPSLVSVAGTYCLRDNLPADIIDKPVQVRFIEGQGLVFKVMEGI